MGRFLSAIGLGFLALLLLTQTAYARHGKVLGTETDSTRVDLSINQGPGFLLPSSPFYFLDLWRDNLSLLLASFNSEAKAKLHLKIAGERITEVKIMLEGKDVDPRGLDIALTNIAENVEGAVATLKQAKNQGKNVETLANELNILLDEEQSSLRIIAKAQDDKFRLKIKALEKELDENEVEIEDELPEDELAKETEEELEEKLEGEREEATKASIKAKSFEEELKKKATPTPTPRKEDGSSGSSGSRSSSSGSLGNGDSETSGGSSGSGSSGSGTSGSGSSRSSN